MSEPRCVCENPGARRTQICPVCSPKADTILSPRGEQTEAVAPFMWAYECVDDGRWQAFTHQLKRADGSICPGVALYRHPPAHPAGAEAPSVVGALRQARWAIVQMREVLDRLHLGTDGFEESRAGGVQIADKALAALSPQALGEAHGSSSPKSEDTHRVAETPVVGWQPTSEEIANAREAISTIRASLSQRFGGNPALWCGLGEVGVDIEWLENVCDHFDPPAPSPTAGDE